MIGLDVSLDDAGGIVEAVVVVVGDALNVFNGPVLMRSLVE